MLDWKVEKTVSPKSNRTVFTKTEKINGSRVVTIIDRNVRFYYNRRQPIYSSSVEKRSIGGENMTIASKLYITETGTEIFITKMYYTNKG